MPLVIGLCKTAILQGQILAMHSSDVVGIVPLLDAFKADQQALELVFPRKGPLDPHPQRMDGSIEEPLASALGVLAVAGILWDVGDQASIENAFPIMRGIEATIEVEVGVSQI